MNRYRRILVPYDGSAAAQRALDEAIVLASDDGVIRLIHIVNEMAPPANRRPPAADGLKVAEASRVAGERLLTESVARVLAAGVTAEGHLYDNGESRISALVCSDAKQWGADLIVMGTHGRRGIRRLVLGSEAEAVVHQTKIPVLLVREARLARAGGVATQR
jgi:nucleotide-binding universal stress UspA family protein